MKDSSTVTALSLAVIAITAFTWSTQTTAGPTGSPCTLPSVCIDAGGLAALAECCQGAATGGCVLPADLVSAVEPASDLHALVLERLALAWPRLFERYFAADYRTFRPRAALRLLQDNPDAAGSGAEWSALVDDEVRRDVEVAVAAVKVARVQDGRGGSSLVVLPAGADALVSVILRELRADPGFEQEELEAFETQGLAPGATATLIDIWRDEAADRALGAARDDADTVLRSILTEARQRGESDWAEALAQIVRTP